MKYAVNWAALAAALVLLGASAAGPGCSHASSDGGDGDGGASDFGEASTTYPAYAPSVPQVVNPYHGYTLKDFTVVPVVFAGDPGVSHVTDFLTKYAASAEWTATVQEYGVGSMTIGATVTITEPAPSALTGADVDGWLQGKLDGTHPEWGPTDPATLAKTIFVVLYPSGTKLLDQGGLVASCDGFIGYHNQIFTRGDGGAPEGGDAGAADADAGAVGVILYAVIPRCAATPLNEAQTQTSAIAHEVIETATDPLPDQLVDGGAAFEFLDPDHLVWEWAVGGSEVADLCTYVGTFWVPPELGYSVTRSWSNQAAKQYHDPCVPGPPGEPYFNSFVATPDSFLLFADVPESMTKGITVPVGQTNSFDVMLFSDRATDGPWLIEATEQPVRGTNPPALSVALDRPRGVNGEKVHLLITANASTPTGTSSVTIVSTLGAKSTLWYTAVSLR